MATLVQTPSVTANRITQLQAIQRPQGTSASGTVLRMLQNIAPQVQKGVEDYKKSTADYNFALGQNDALNGIQRSVFVMDNAAYNAGKAYQNMNSAQMEADTEFEAKVKQGIEDGKNADELWDIGAEQLRKHTELIYNNADIPTEIKEDLYQSNLKRQAAYQKYIGSTIAQKKQELYVFDRNNRAAQLSKDLTSDNTPEGMSQYLETFKDNSIRQNIDVMGMKPEEAANAADGEITGVLKYMAARISPDNPDAASYYEDFQLATDTAVEKGYISMANATLIREEVLNRRKITQDHNDNVAELEYAQQLFDYELGNQEYDPVADTPRLVDGIMNNPNISEDKKLSLINKVTSMAERVNTRSLAAASDVTPEGLMDSNKSLQQYEVEGGTKSEYVDLKSRYILAKYPSNPMGAGLAMLRYAGSGDAAGDGVYLPELAKRGGEWISNAIMPNLKATDSELANTESGKQRVQSWNQVKQQYNLMKATNPSLAEGLLDGFPEEQRSIVEATLEANGSLGDLRNNIANAPAIAQKKANFSKAVKELDWSTVNKASGRTERNILSNAWGVDLLKNKDIDNQQIAVLRNLALSNASSLSLSSNQGTGKELLNTLWNQGYMVQSKTGRNHIITPQAMRAFAQLTGKGAATRDYVSNALDKYRGEVAKKLNISQDQIFVNSDPSGKYLHLNLMNKDGTTLAGYPHGISITQAQFKSKLNITIKDLDSRGSKKEWGDVVGRVNTTRGGSYSQSNQAPFTRAATDVFNGNVGLTKQLLGQFAEYEGFVVNPQMSQTTLGQRSVSVIGHGINLNAHGNTVSPNGQTWGQRAKAAAGNPAKVMALESEFMKGYYSSLKTVPSKLGFPPITAAPYNQHKAESLKFVADMMWLGGQDSGRNLAVKILNAPNVNAALSIYNSGYIKHGKTKSGGEHRRVTYHKNLIRNHFRYNR